MICHGIRAKEGSFLSVQNVAYLQEAPTHNNQGHHLGTVHWRAALAAIDTHSKFIKFIKCSDLTFAAVDVRLLPCLGP